MHQQGRLDEARAAYEEVLQLQPRDDGAAHFFQGSAHSMLNNHEAAIAHFDRAIALKSGFEADAHYRRGMALKELKQRDAAITGLTTAIALGSSFMVEAHFNRGILLHELGRFEEAIRSFDALSALGLNNEMVFFNRGLAETRLERFAAAVASFDQALALRPDWFEAVYCRGIALAGLKQYGAALSSYDRALVIDADRAEVHFSRGNVLLKLRQFAQARESFQRTVALRPRHAHALNGLGKAHEELGELEAALAAYRAAMQVGEVVAAFNNAGALERSLGRLDEAEQTLRRGLALDPGVAALHMNLGNVSKDAGDAYAALACNRQALALDPSSHAALSNVMFLLAFTSEDPAAVRAEGRRFNEVFAKPLHREARRPAQDRTCGRRLRIGYVSPDFREHCQSLFTLPLLENHDHAAFEIVCYSSVKRPDAITQRIVACADQFREVTALDDEALAGLVRKDGIDILVDLTMHMGNGRPLLFARRPAPLQVAWLAYPGTTGLEAIDYRISDPRLDPAGTESSYCERTIRLPDAFWCYSPLVSLPPPNPLPALRRGHITFGCLNNPCKLTDQTLRLWASVLAAVPDSRLLLLAPGGSYRTQLLERARSCGLDIRQIEFVGYRPRLEYLCSYGDIDLVLDTYPYNGHTTSLDSLWMGVPVVTRVGATAVGRGGLSQLYQLGLTELASNTDAGFAERALGLVQDLPRLAALRSELRARLENSPLMDGPRFAGNMEAAYRHMWAH
jgi:protein O-GlcNAc transferase